uniref:E-selectin n=1 Tax=Seriola dumerili TaxID=41447 RepID=A0A3B4TYM4_SERDU
HQFTFVSSSIYLILDLSRGGGAQAWTYSYSTTPNRRWHEARKWCHQHLTNMVTIQTPEETDFINNLLPFNQKYYWIGIHKVDGVWTREGNNETVLEDVQNWAPKEPDNIVGQDCVEIYIKRDKDTAKWNNEKCQSKKGTVCYSASCTQDSCSAHADCVETVGNYTCQCHPGFHGPRCEEAKKCNPINSPPHGSLSCSDPHGSFSFGSRCMTTCDEGFLLNGTANAECTSLGMWSADIAHCSGKENTNCLHPAAVNCSQLFSFGSRCTSACEEGFVLSGTADTECTSVGTWSTDTPRCLAKKCPSLNSPAHGSSSCSDPHGEFSFGSRCTSTCEEGFVLNGTADTECTSLGHWSQDLPTSVQCETIPASSLPLSMNCSHPLGHFSFGSQCLFTCTGGFSLNGTDVLLCSSAGFWSDSLPNCTGKMYSTACVQLLLLSSFLLPASRLVT